MSSCLSSCKGSLQEEGQEKDSNSTWWIFAKLQTLGLGHGMEELPKLFFKETRVVLKRTLKRFLEKKTSSE